MKFDWKNPKDDIHVCNDGAGQTELGKKTGTYRATVLSGNRLVAELEECSNLHSAKRLVETQLEKLASAPAC